MTTIHSKRTNPTPKSLPGQTSTFEAPKHVTVVRRPAVAHAVAETKPANEPLAPPKPAKLSYEKRMRELSPAARLQRKLASNTKRMAKIVDEVSRWTNAAELRVAAVAFTESLTALNTAAAALSDVFKPEREPKGNARRFTPGAKVILRDAVSAKYDGILEPEERRNLEVVSVSSGKHARVVAVKTASGVRLVLPRAHLVKAAPEDGGTAVPSIGAPPEVLAVT